MQSHHLKGSILIILVALGLATFFAFYKVFVIEVVTQCTTDTCCTKLLDEPGMYSEDEQICVALKERYTKIVRGNPATERCIESGAIVEVREDEQGNEYGMCVFSDGRECEQWKFYEGNCE